MSDHGQQGAVICRSHRLPEMRKQAQAQVARNSARQDRRFLVAAQVIGRQQGESTGEKHMIELGKKARDKITGFEGIITGRCQYITGCDQYGLVPPARDGKVEGAQWFDEGRIEVIGDGVSADSVRAERNGGPNRDAPSR